MQIRQIDKSELDIIIDLHLEGLHREIEFLNKLISGKSADNTGKPHLKKALYHMLHTGECNIFVAKDENEYIGYCLVTKKVYPVEQPRINGCINGIYVKEENRRQGIGKQLFEMAASWLKKEHVKIIELFYMINDERAAAFWEKMGFKNIQYNCMKNL